MEQRIDGAGFSSADELVGEGRMRRGRKRDTRTSEARTLVGQVTRGADELVRQGGQVGQGGARTWHAVTAVPEAASGAIVLKINPKPRRRLPLWRRAGKRSQKKKKNLSAFP